MAALGYLGYPPHYILHVAFATLGYPDAARTTPLQPWATWATRVDPYSATLEQGYPDVVISTPLHSWLCQIHSIVDLALSDPLQCSPSLPVPGLWQNCTVP